MRHRSIGLSSLLVLVTGVVAAGHAEQFAAEGRTGTLRVNVVVSGEGRLPASRNYDHLDWKAHHTAQFTVELKADQPSIDDTAANLAKAEEVRAALPENFEEELEALEEEWDEKIDACDGDEQCEDRVEMQKMADPRFQRLAGRMMGAAPGILEKAAAMNTNLRMQYWRYDGGPVSGRISADQTEAAVGVPSEEGGKVNRTERYVGAEAIGTVGGVVLKIDAQAKTFELGLPADLTIETTECKDPAAKDCVPAVNKRSVRLLGPTPLDAPDWPTALRVTGSVESTESPRMSGKKTLKASLAAAGDPATRRPVQVTIDWSFEAAR